jgi:hypothetical protein
MTTTNDGGIHPMVMKAALSLRNSRAEVTGSSREQVWHYEKEKLIADAQTALTECGALAVLEALEASERVKTNADADAAHMLAYHAIAKVYGSAP